MKLQYEGNLYGKIGRRYIDTGFTTVDYQAFEDEIVRLKDGVRDFIIDNRHLADDDDCTLKVMKDLINFEFSEEF